MTTNKKPAVKPSPLKTLSNLGYLEIEKRKSIPQESRKIYALDQLRANLDYLNCELAKESGSNSFLRQERRLGEKRRVQKAIKDQIKATQGIEDAFLSTLQSLGTLAQYHKIDLEKLIPIPRTLEPKRKRTLAQKAKTQATSKDPNQNLESPPL